MRILVFGAGSLGSALGGLLSQRHEVALVGRRENMDAIRARGLHLSGAVETHASVDALETVEGVEEPDLVVITTKAYHTRAVVDALKALPWRETDVLTLQNGLGNLEAVRAWKGPKAFGGTTSIGAVLTEPGEVVISGLGRTVIGSDLDSRAASRIADTMASCGVQAEVSEDIVREIWSKAVVNACINPLTAVLRVPNGRLLESAVVRRLMSDVCAESESVARAAGVFPSGHGVLRRVTEVARGTAGNRSSMLRDVERGRRTEIRFINGMICKTGTYHGVPTPLNRALTHMVEALEPHPP